MNYKLILELHMLDVLIPLKNTGHVLGELYVNGKEGIVE